MFSEKEYAGLGKVPVGIGAVLRGWDLTEKQFRSKLPVIDFRAMKGNCPHNCFHCFTEKRFRTLTLPQIKRVIDEAAKIGTRGINFLGEGEPTIDPDFFEIIEYTFGEGIIPVVFTEAAAKMQVFNFVHRVKRSGASVCPKCDSLFNPSYQNMVVGDKSGKYFGERNLVLAFLVNEGFNAIKADGTTRLGFDMVVSKYNFDEVESTLRYCRERNIWIVFTFFLPAGKSGAAGFDRSVELTPNQKKKMRDMIYRIDRDEFGFDHKIWSNFATMPCVERLQIYGNGQVSPCPGNEIRIGTVQESSLDELQQAVIAKFPCHNPTCFDGNCLYRKED